MADDNKKNSAADQLIKDTTGGRGAAPPQPAAGAQGPGNAHGIPSAHERDTEGKPFDPEGGKPASDTKAMARKVLD